MDNQDAGYKKPPKSGQFKKGESGNPRGRPPGRSKVLTKDDRWQVLQKIANSKLHIKAPGGIQEVTYYEALYKKLFQMALNGDLGAARLLAPLIEKIFHEGTEKFVERQKLVKEIARALETQKPGIFGPSIPDPNDLIAKLIQLISLDLDQEPETTVTLHFEEKLKPPEDT